MPADVALRHSMNLREGNSDYLVDVAPVTLME